MESPSSLTSVLPESARGLGHGFWIWGFVWLLEEQGSFGIVAAWWRKGEEKGRLVRCLPVGAGVFPREKWSNGAGGGEGLRGGCGC